MGNLTTALVFVVALNVFMYLGQVAILDINPDATSFYTNEDTILNEFNEGDAETPVLDTSVSDKLPGATGSISPTTGNLFTDIFTNAKTWFLESTGLKYVATMLSAPYNWLKVMHLPNEFVYAVGTLWYVITLFLLIAFIWGGGRG